MNLHSKHFVESPAILYNIHVMEIVDWVEEQMAPLVESMEPKKVRTYDDILCDAQEETVDLNWIHYLGKSFIIFKIQ